MRTRAPNRATTDREIGIGVVESYRPKRYTPNQMTLPQTTLRIRVAAKCMCAVLVACAVLLSLTLIGTVGLFDVAIFGPMRSEVERRYVSSKEAWARVAYGTILSGDPSGGHRADDHARVGVFAIA